MVRNKKAGWTITEIF